jgi:membrane protease YdiL (CAAX protease family)
LKPGRDKNLMNTDLGTTTHKVNWRQVGTFIALTFVLTLAIDAALWLTVGYGTNFPTLLFLQTQMLIPAFSAILLGLFFFKDSPIYFRTFRERARWFLIFFLIYTVLYAVLAALSVSASEETQIVISAVSSSLTLLALLVLISARGFSSKEAFARANMRGGRFRDWVGWGLAFVLFYALQTALNALFRLGQPVDPVLIITELGGSGIPNNLILPLMAFQTILIGSLIGLPLAFGEEYGWRGYLQGELVRLGKKRGILLLGLIWSVWHWPIILMGHNYPGYPLQGVALMTGYTTLLAFVLGYVIFKTGSVWLAAFLHALNNQTYAYFATFVYTPANPVLSFGPGLFGVLSLAVVVALILLDPLWREPSASIPEMETRQAGS